ncbi:hypothetical protein HPB47_007770 [Ixodes persulcatus]|uniref:Uncharacterized protein n=1 Tax=Ixodes persulcatus TaxID=34615 RepID=A0AC60P6J1_IXOPE|nr:hypothetical protein HPB47_007770 [Ixodes persulcatus]
MEAASGEPSGNPWELTDDALEPGSCRGGSAAVHATEFRPTGAPGIAAAQEQAAADPLPQRTNERVPDIPSTECVPTAYRVGTTTRTAAPFISLTVAGKEFAALLDSGASASLIGDEVLRHLQQKSVRGMSRLCGRKGAFAGTKRYQDFLDHRGTVLQHASRRQPDGIGTS